MQHYCCRVKSRQTHGIWASQSEATKQIYITGMKQLSVGTWPLIASPVADVCSNTEMHPLPVRAPVHRRAHQLHQYVLWCQSASPAILIVRSPQSWYEQKGRPWQNLAHQRLPPLVLQVACLFGGAQAWESQRRGLERRRGFPAGMSLMG